ncbi:MAG: PilZ domain-containing protein [Myxococcaceae bacterium]
MNVISELAQIPLIAPRPRRVEDRRQTERRAGERPPVPTEADRRGGKDRRASPRIEVEVDCEEIVDGMRSFRVTRDLSTFGVCTRFGYPHRVGMRFEMVLYLPDDRTNPVQVQAEVVGWNEGGAGMRVAFRNPPGEAVRRIHRYLRSRSNSRAA